MIPNKEKLFNILDKMESADSVLVVGDVGVDKYTFGTVSRISPEAPVPVLEVTKEWNKLGLAANVSDNLNALKIRNQLLSVVGDDTHANLLENLMLESGQKIEGIIRLPHRKTTLKERVLTKGQQICRVDYETLGELTSSEEKMVVDEFEKMASQFEGLIIEDYGKGLMTEVVTRKMITSFRDQGKFVAVDPSRKTPPHYYRGVSLLKPNRDESQLMAHSFGYREKNTENIAYLLLEKLGLEKIIITLGEEGMAMVDTKADSKFTVIPTMAKEVYDVSGAGDTAISVLVSALMAKASLEDAAFLANCASSIVVGKRGTATCSMSELREFCLDLY